MHLTTQYFNPLSLHDALPISFSTAFFAKSPAPNITRGFDVFVHEVIAAIANEPVFMTDVFPFGCSTVTSLSNLDLSLDHTSTRLNFTHLAISYAVSCLSNKTT